MILQFGDIKYQTTPIKSGEIRDAIGVKEFMRGEYDAPLPPAKLLLDDYTRTIVESYETYITYPRMVMGRFGTNTKKYPYSHHIT